MTFPVFQEPEACFDPESVTLSYSLETSKCGDRAEPGNGRAHVITSKLHWKGCPSACLGADGVMPANACSALGGVEGGYQMPWQGQFRLGTKADYWHLHRACCLLPRRTGEYTVHWLRNGFALLWATDAFCEGRVGGRD